MKLLKITSLFFLIFISLKGNAQTNFEWTKRSPYFTNGIATLGSYIDLGEIRYWGFIEISLTDSYSNANTTGLYKKVYNIGTNAVTLVPIPLKSSVLLEVFRATGNWVNSSEIPMIT
jgi:hypothetical protein